MENIPQSADEPIVETTSEADKAGFEKIRRLTEEEGWTFGGHIFEADQKYHVTLKKGDLEEIILLGKPYPKMFFAKDPEKAD